MLLPCLGWCFLYMLGKLQKGVCRTVRSSLAAPLEHLAHWQNLASSILFYRYNFGRFSCELDNQVPSPYSRGSHIVILIGYLIFLSTFRDVVSMSTSTVIPYIPYVYGILHWRIFIVSYRKLAWVGFEPTTVEFRSGALTDWVIRPWVQLAVSQLCTATSISSFVQCSRFIWAIAFVSRHLCFKRNLAWVIYMKYK